MRFQSELGVSIRFRGASLGFRGVSILNSGVTGVSICAFFYLGRLCEVARAFAPPPCISQLTAGLEEPVDFGELLLLLALHRP